MKYYKYYTKDGKCAKIKFQKNIIANLPIIIKFKRPDDELWNFHTPDKTFKNSFEVIEYILENLETNRTKFKVVQNDFFDF